MRTQRRATPPVASRASHPSRRSRRSAQRRLLTPTDHVTRIAAVAAAIGFAGIALFQAVLAAGAALGDAAWGGAHAHLSTADRIGSAVAVFVWTAAALIVLG